MKIHISKTRRCQGAALLITAVILVFVGAALATYLLLIQNEYAAVNRSQTWNTSLDLTEAGVEDALALMNKYDGNVAMVPQWCTLASLQQDGWTINGNIYSMHRVVDPNVGYYDVSIDNSISNAPVITCTGSAYRSLSASAAPPFMFAAAGLPVSTIAPATRTVQVKATYSALFPNAITTKQNINLNGNNVRVDSYDSTISNDSAWVSQWGYGVYNPSLARAHGDVATDSALVGAISVGQANIYGHLDTGPGGSATIGHNGYVGPLPQSGSGIQTGYSSDDMNVAFPDVVLPTGAGNWQYVPANNVITNSGNYVIFGIYNNLTINAPNVTLYVNGNINLSGYEAITIGTNATATTLYVSGPFISLTGQATVNNLAQNAHYLGVYGLPSLTSINFGGNAAFTGTIYAPEANFSFGGGGNNTYDYAGSLIANSCTLNGHANFHYDESLKRNGPGIGYIPASWKEISGDN
jgi:hypothetical protein